MEIIIVAVFIALLILGCAAELAGPTSLAEISRPVKVEHEDTLER